MRKGFPSSLGTGLRFSSWPTALIGIVVIKAVLSLALTPGSFLFDYSGISYFLLLFLATCFAIPQRNREQAGDSAILVVPRNCLFMASGR